MKLKLQVLAAGLLAFALATPAQALLITPSSGTPNINRWQGNCAAGPNGCGTAAIRTLINALLPGVIDTELYKSDVSGSSGAGADAGLLAGSYDTGFSNTNSDPSNAMITYRGGSYVGAPAYVLVKDGNQSPAWYLFKLSGLNAINPIWNGTETLFLRGFWPAQGAISQVALFGQSTPPAQVPDGGSVSMLLGLSLIGLAGLRRMMA